MIVKIHELDSGAHVRARFFVGPTSGSLALAGELTFRHSEWTAFLACLQIGSTFTLELPSVVAGVKTKPEEIFVIPDGAVVHVLSHGFAACAGKPGGEIGWTVPRDWPKGHLWVQRGAAELSTCELCRQAEGLSPG